MTDTTKTKKPADETKTTKELVQDIAETRADMTETIAAIETRLEPSALREQAIEKIEEVQDRVREGVREQISETKQAVKAELQEAKAAVKREVREAVDGISHAVHDATIGRAKIMARQASDTVVDTSDTVMDTLRRNPVPAALVGVGLVWLLMNRNGGGQRRGTVRQPAGYRGRLLTYDASGRSYDDDERSTERRFYDGPVGRADERDGGRYLARAQEAALHTMHDARDAATGLARRVGVTAESVQHTAGAALDSAKSSAAALAQRAADEASHLRDVASDRGHELAERSREGYRYAADKGREGYDFAAEKGREGVERVEQTYDESPLAIGAIALGLGAALGLALPRTERENRVLGPYRDQVVGMAREAAHDAIGQVQGMGERAGEEARRQLAQASGAD